jgi:uncharacterized membrane protein YbhN (UPF0104 family)
MIRALIRIAVAAIVLAVLASRVDLAAVRTALAATPLRAVALATFAAFASNLVIAFRLRVLLAAQGVPARTRQTFAINLAASFYNLFFPVGGVGVAVLRLQRLSRRTRGRYTAALTAMVCDRLAAIVALGFVGLVCWIADPGVKPAGGLLVLLGGLSVVGVLVAPRAVPSQVRHFVREIQTGGSGTWWSAALFRLSSALGSVARLSPAALARILGISALAQLPGILVFAALGQGVGLPVSLVAMGWVRSVVVLITVIPLSIGGLGLREGALVFTLAAFGVPAHDAFALSILIFATTILAPGLAGGVLEGVRWLRGSGRRPRAR